MSPSKFRLVTRTDFDSLPWAAQLNKQDRQNEETLFEANRLLTSAKYPQWSSNG